MAKIVISHNRHNKTEAKWPRNDRAGETAASISAKLQNQSAAPKTTPLRTPRVPKTSLGGETHPLGAYSSGERRTLRRGLDKIDWAAKSGPANGGMSIITRLVNIRASDFINIYSRNNRPRWPEFEERAVEYDPSAIGEENECRKFGAELTFLANPWGDSASGLLHHLPNELSLVLFYYSFLIPFQPIAARARKTREALSRREI